MIGITIARFFVIFFNGLLFVFAIVLLVSGTTVHLNNYSVIDRADTNYAEVLHVIKIPDVIGNTAIFVITAGAVSLIFSIFGCCAAAMHSRYAFLAYWIVILLLTLFEIAVLIYILVYPEQRRVEIKEKTYDSLKDHFKPVSKVPNITWKELENIHSEDSVQDYWLKLEIRGCSEVVISAVRVFAVYAAGLFAVAIGIQIILVCAAIYLWTKFQ